MGNNPSGRPPGIANTTVPGLNEAIAAELKEERLRQGLLQRQVAERAGLSGVNGGGAAVSRYERGTVTHSSHALVAIADALNVNPATMLQRALDRMEWKAKNRK